MKNASEHFARKFHLSRYVHSTRFLSIGSLGSKVLYQYLPRGSVDREFVDIDVGTSEPVGSPPALCKSCGAKKFQLPQQDDDSHWFAQACLPLQLQTR